MADKRAMLLALAVLAGPVLAGCVGAAESSKPSPPLEVAAAPTEAPNDTPFDMRGPFSRVRVPGPYHALPDAILTIPDERDGEPLQIGIVRPDVPDGTRVPVILYASGWLADLDEPDPETGAPRPLRDHREGETNSAFLIDNFVQHGYAVAMNPLRGSGGSGGCNDSASPAERAALDQVITWLGTRSWSDGNVGMYGLSWAGFSQYVAAGNGNPHLRTIVPVGGIPDLYDFLFRNGTMNPLGAVFDGGFAPVLPTSFYRTGPREPSSFTPCEGTAEARAAIAQAIATGAREPASFWDDRSSRSKISRETLPSMLLVHGFRDSSVYPHSVLPWATHLADAGVDVKMVIGPWTHASHPDTEGPVLNPFYTDNILNPMPSNPARRWDWAEVVHAWYDLHLKGDATVDVGPPVEVADNEGQWRAEQRWPPSDVEWLGLGLDPDGSLSVGDPGAGSRTIVGGPTWQLSWARPSTFERQCALDDCARKWDEDACPGCAFFRSAPIEDDVRIAGLPRLPITVVPSGPGGLVTAYLYVDDGPGVGQDGSGLTRVSWAQMDLRYAAGGYAPTDVTPGEELVAMMEFQPIDHHIRPGARIVVGIGQGSGGDAATFPGLAYHAPSRPSGPIELKLGPGLSTLELPTIERPPGEVLS